MLTKEELFKKYNFIREAKKSNNLVGRRDELNSLKESMLKKRMRNTIMIGNAGCGKSQILEQFAYDEQKFYNIIELDIAGCVGGTSLRGEFEEKLTNFLNDVSDYNATNYSKIIVFIDEIHNLYRAGGGEGAVDAVNILKKSLSRGEITVIGATTVKEFSETIAKDKAFVRRFSTLMIKDLDEKTNLSILAKFNNNVLPEEMVKYIYDKSQTLNRTNPDISIEILDRCLAKKSYWGNEITKATVNKIIASINEVDMMG